ncbi:MAG: hypothetical protein JSW68_03095 [Burkholderiales bacterium]|nr:MAG: hypothetical protein JSW68_03095 [Burkholderiales bacterium]
MRRLNTHFGSGVQQLAELARDFVRAHLPDRAEQRGLRERGLSDADRCAGRVGQRRRSDVGANMPRAAPGQRFPRYQMLRALERLYAGDLLVIAGDCSHAIAIGHHAAVFVYQPLLDNNWVEPVEGRNGLENVRYYALSREGCGALLKGRNWYRSLPRWRRLAIRLYE